MGTSRGKVRGLNAEGGVKNMWSIFLRIVALIAKYGKRAVDWCWANRNRIYDWIRNGMAVDWIINRILEILGLR